MKIMVCGHARHGKDTFCELLGIPFNSSSAVALDKVIWRKLNMWYANPQMCFEDRVNQRDIWRRLITEYNTPDKTRLARDIFADNDVYCGIRDPEEFAACRREGLFDLAIWVDACERLPPEPTNGITPAMCDIIVNNNGDLDQLVAKVDRISKMLTGKEASIKAVQRGIVAWADSVFPDRTITNAIQKLVLEEIPEYLMDQTSGSELADIGILLFDIADMAGIDLGEAIEAKLSVNRARKWGIDNNTGLMRHVGDD